MQRATGLLEPRDPRASEGEASLRLAFLDALLASDSDVGAAQHALDALVRGRAITQAVVFLVDVDAENGPRLVIAASYGIGARSASASIELADREHVLVRSLTATRPTPLVTSTLEIGDLELDLVGPRLTAYPLVHPTRPEGHPLGLVVVGPVATEAFARWVFGALSSRLSDLRAHRTLESLERRLERTRGLLHVVLRCVPDPVLLTDRDGRLLLANPRAEAYFVAEEEDSEGRRRAIALNTMLFSASLAGTPARPSEDYEPVLRELPLVDPDDGSDRLFEIMSAPIGMPDGPGVVSVLRNVTDLQLATIEIEENYRKLRVAEAEVRAERFRLDLIIDSVADPIVVTDASGTRIMSNAPAERLFGTGEAATSDEVRRVRSNDAQFSSHVANVFFTESGRRFGAELALVDPKTGAEVPVEAISGKIVSDAGEVTAVVTILHDRTEANENARLYAELKSASSLLEERIRAATEELVLQNELLQRQALELEQASSAKTQFLANMSHELRTPLNAILGYTNMLIQGVSGQLPAPAIRQLTRVDSNSKHLLTIINDILDIARIEAGKMPLNVVRFDVGDLVREVLAEVEPLIARSRLAVGCHLARKLPAMRADRAKVKQILMNLISNALKFTPAGSVTVTVARARRRDEVVISVRDTGIGIAEKDRETVFQAFRQVDDSPTRQYGGTGLGLAICKRLAAVLGGQIRLTSQLGEGSTFSLSLPRRAGAR